jgi:hypothetical protein
MGAPGKVIRAAGDREKVMIDGGWPTYVDHAARYCAQLLKNT